MCHLSVKLSDMFYQNPHTLDKIVGNTFQHKCHQSLIFSRKVKVITKLKCNDLGNQNYVIPKQFEQGIDPLVTGVMPTSMPTQTAANHMSTEHNEISNSHFCDNVKQRSVNT